MGIRAVMFFGSAGGLAGSLMYAAIGVPGVFVLIVLMGGLAAALLER